MGFMGFGLVLAGLWVLDSAIQGRAPLKSLQGILAAKPGTTGAKAASYDGSLAPVVDTALEGDTATNTPNDTATAGSGNPSAAASTAVQYAVAQVGKPYQWGATGPSSFDCSGLCMKAYQAAGVNIGRTTYQQILAGQPVTGGLLPGDLVFPDSGHVEIVIGGGQTVQAPHTGAFVELAPIPSYIAARRIVASVMTVTR